MSKKRLIKNKQPIYIAAAFFIYITAAVFIFVFAANTGPVMAHNSSVLKSLPNITKPDIKIFREPGMPKITGSPSFPYSGGMCLFMSVYAHL